MLAAWLDLLFFLIVSSSLSLSLSNVDWTWRLSFYVPILFHFLFLSCSPLSHLDLICFSPFISHFYSRTTTTKKFHSPVNDFFHPIFFTSQSFFVSVCWFRILLLIGMLSFDILLVQSYEHIPYLCLSSSCHSGEEHRKYPSSMVLFYFTQILMTIRHRELSLKENILVCNLIQSLSCMKRTKKRLERNRCNSFMISPTILLVSYELDCGRSILICNSFLRNPHRS